MVAPYREFRNITLSASTTHSTTNNMASSNDIDMNINPLDNLFDISDNFDKVRDCSLALSAHRPRFSSLSSSDCEEEYYIRVKRVCDRMDKDDSVALTGSIQIKYAT